MKLNKTFFTLSVALVSLISCQEDFLNEKPTNELTLEDAIKNENNLNTAVNGLYNFLSAPEVLGGDIQSLNELLADHAFVSSKNSGRFNETRNPDLSFYIRQNGYFRTVWQNLYRTINNANIILSFEGKIADEANVAGEPDQLFAEAKAVRALSYYHLVALYSENYGGGNQELGVPVVLQYDINGKPSRNSVQEVYTQILKDLNEAESKISDRINVRFGKTAVQLLLSRVYLAQKNYAKANEYAQLVLDNNSYTLLNKNNVASYFTLDGESSPETIFQLEFNGNRTNSLGIVGTWGTSGSYKQNFATRAFYNQLPANDVRKDVWYTTEGLGADLNNYPDSPKPVDVRKYTTDVRDIVLFRKTEAVFNQIEALYHLNPALASQKLEGWVANYRSPGYTVSATGNDLLKEILFQKNAEFFLEGFRYQDLKRNGFSYTNPQTGVQLTPANIGFKAFAIPEYETNNNPNIAQFPGY